MQEINLLTPRGNLLCSNISLRRARQLANDGAGGFRQKLGNACDICSTLDWQIHAVVRGS